jgi:hypothetical protein
MDGKDQECEGHLGTPGVFLDIVDHIAIIVTFRR